MLHFTTWDCPPPDPHHSLADCGGFAFFLDSAKGKTIHVACGEQTARQLVMALTAMLDYANERQRKEVGMRAADMDWEAVKGLVVGSDADWQE